MPARELFRATIGLFLLVLSSMVKCQAICGVDNLPEFRDTEHFQREGLTSKISAVVPSYTFTCAGVVTRWGAHVERRRNRHDRYEMTFSVWRPAADGCTLAKVGENFHPGLAPEIDEESRELLGSVILYVHKGERFLVEPGDIVGFSVRHYEVEWPSEREVAAGVASVMVDRNRTDIATYVWSTAAALESTLPCFHEGTNVTAAPVISVEMSRFAVCFLTWGANLESLGSCTHPITTIPHYDSELCTLHGANA